MRATRLLLISVLVLTVLLPSCKPRSRVLDAGGPPPDGPTPKQADEVRAIRRVKRTRIPGGYTVEGFYWEVVRKARRKGGGIIDPVWEGACKQTFCRVTLTFMDNSRPREAIWQVTAVVRPLNRLAALLMRKGNQWSPPLWRAPPKPRSVRSRKARRD